MHSHRAQCLCADSTDHLLECTTSRQPPYLISTTDGADVEIDVTCQAMASQGQCDPQLTQCYSGLMVAMEIGSSPYDTLDLYEKMDPLNSETDTAGSRLHDGTMQVSEEGRYTTPVPRRGFSESSHPSSNDYLEMVGAKKKSVMYVDSHNDSGEDNHADGEVKACPNEYEDYLQPGHKAVDN